MSEAEILRLVRCPKCQNLLPELAGYNVYQCGGCGAVLRAKVKQDAEVLDEKDDDGKLGMCGTLIDVSGKVVQENVKSSPEIVVTKDGIGSDCVALELKESNGVKMDQYLNPPHAPIKESVVKVDSIPGLRNEGKMEKCLDNIGNVSLARGPGDMPRWRGEISNQYRNFRDGNEGGRAMRLNYQEDGPSNYISDSSCSNAKAEEVGNDLNMPKDSGSLHKDRAELLQMMEELTYQLRRSGNLTENMKEKGPMNQNVAHRGCSRSSTSHVFYNNVPGSSAGMHEDFTPDKPTVSPYNDRHYPQQYGGRRRNRVSNPHHFPHCHNDMPGYGNNFEMQMMRRTLPTPYHFEHQLHHPPYYPGQPFAEDSSLYAPNSNNGLPRRPVCGFYNCCIDHHRATQADYLDDTRFYGVNSNFMPCPRNVHVPSAQHRYNFKTFDISSNLIDNSVETRLADKDNRCYTRGYARPKQRKGKLAKIELHCQPIASGAPFIICQGCSKLLQLPKMTFKHNSKQRILCCGACSTVMVCVLINGKFSISVSGESKKIAKGVGSRLDEVAGEGNSSELRWAKMNSVSDSFYNSGYETQAITGNPHVTRGLDFTSHGTQDSQSLPTSSPASFEGVESSENVASTSPHHVPLQDQHSHSFNANVTNSVWKGSHSTRSDHEKEMPKDVISRQSSLNETSTTAQIDEVSFNVYSKTGVPQNSEPTTIRNDIEKTKGSSFACAVKKGLKGLSRSNHSSVNKDRNATVNGYTIPERMLKKAEKLAGPIHPGNYWYDFRAGFWGVIGGPCLGIIPPCIEEFNYPMQANCSSGATGVLVNGRELQQIDLDLLASRGLPTAKGRSYVIEISGKVVDKDSGEELDGLGKLAPTIEKVKHGFGMKPRTQIVQ